MTKSALIEQHTATERNVVFIPLDQLPKSTHVQVREEQDGPTVARYAEAYLSCLGMPPVIIYVERRGADDEAYWLADGHHRVAGAKKAGHKEINAILKKGDRRAAMLYAIKANPRNGLPLNAADKRKSVALMLADAEWRQWSDRVIAETCHVGGHLVADMRKKLPADQQSEVRKGKDGTVRNTANIGKKAKPVEVIRSTSYPGHAGGNAIEDQEPEELSLAPAAVPAAPTPPRAAVVPTVTSSLAVDQSTAQRTLIQTRLVLAEKLEKGKDQWRGTERQLVSLALVTGVPTDPQDESWSDDLVGRCMTTLADRLKHEVIDRLRTPGAFRLPPLDLLGSWWGVDIRACALIAERALG